MRTVSSDTITQAFLDYCGPETSPRVKEVLTSLTTHLHAFAKEVNLTHDEWRLGLELLMKTGEISDAERNEYVLMSDVLGLSSLVDMINSPEVGTPSSVLGPFHILGAPDIEHGADMKGENEGPTVFVSGRILQPNGEPIKSAEMEIWQTADNGLYSNQDEAQSEYNLRGHLHAQEDGRYLFCTVRPAPYTVPDDGPVGVLLHATGRHPWRPSHLHFIVTAPGFRTLVTEVFPSDDPYLDEDAVFGVRDALVMEYQEQTDLSAIPADMKLKHEPTMPFYTVDFDLVLSPDA
ncbi:MAG: dioxygenase [Pseudomonadota bacterium]